MKRIVILIGIQTLFHVRKSDFEKGLVFYELYAKMYIKTVKIRLRKKML